MNNILIISSSYPSLQNPQKGIFVKERAKILQKTNTVYLVAVEVDYNSPISFFKYKINKSTSNDFTELKLVVNRSLPIYNQINFLFIAAKEINKMVKKYNIQIIHCQLSFPAGFIGYLLNVINGTPFVITEHASNFTAFLKRRMLFKFLIKRALTKADRIIAVSNNLKDSILKYIKNKIVVIPNFVEIDKFSIISKQNTKWQIGFLGLLDTKRKGLDILLNSLADITNLDYTLHIGGSGKLFDYYQNLAKKLNIHKNCVFYKSILPENTPEFFLKLHFFILPSFNESFGIVLLEAMSSGIPVIATKCGGPEEFVTNEVGLIVERGNTESLTQAIKDMITNYENYDKNVIRSYVKENFSAEIYSKKINEIYSEIIEK